MKAAKHKPVVLEVKPQSSMLGNSEQTFGGARGDAEQVNEVIVPLSKGVRMKRKIFDRRDATTHPRWSAVFGCDEIDQTPVKKPRDSI